MQNALLPCDDSRWFHFRFFHRVEQFFVPFVTPTPTTTLQPAFFRGYLAQKKSLQFATIVGKFWDVFVDNFAVNGQVFVMGTLELVGRCGGYMLDIVRYQ